MVWFGVGFGFWVFSKMHVKSVWKGEETWFCFLFLLIVVHA